VKRGDFAADRVSVDGAAVGAAVAAAYFTNEQVPLLDVRPDDTEASVVDDSLFLVRQRERVLIKPRHLQ